MAGFNDVRGEAQKGIDHYKFSDGDNPFRIISGLRPRYVYWVKNPDGKAMPLECLSFNPYKEKFDNIEKDWARELVPSLQERDPKNPKRFKENCKWAYSALVIDRRDNKVKICDFKKTIFTKLKNAAGKKLGDPIDFENGWDVIATRTKTGERAVDVEYDLDQIACMENKGPLSDEDKKLIADSLDMNIEDINSPDDIDIFDYVPRQTPEEQKKLILEKVLKQEASEEDQDESVPDELKDNSEEGEDIPF